MNKNQFKGHAKAVKGRVKEFTGKILGIKSMEFKGKATKIAGKTEAAYGHLKGKITKTTKK